MLFCGEIPTLLLPVQLRQISSGTPASTSTTTYYTMYLLHRFMRGNIAGLYLAICCLSEEEEEVLIASFAHCQGFLFRQKKIGPPFKGRNYQMSLRCHPAPPPSTSLKKPYSWERRAHFIKSGRGEGGTILNNAPVCPTRECV